jgi:hypothetical protein
MGQLFSGCNFSVSNEVTFDFEKRNLIFEMVLLALGSPVSPGLVFIQKIFNFHELM